MGRVGWYLWLLFWLIVRNRGIWPSTYRATISKLAWVGGWVQVLLPMDTLPLSACHQFLFTISHHSSRLVLRMYQPGNVGLLPINSNLLKAASIGSSSVGSSLSVEPIGNRSRYAAASSDLPQFMANPYCSLSGFVTSMTAIPGGGIEPGLLRAVTSQKCLDSTESRTTSERHLEKAL